MKLDDPFGRVSAQKEARYASFKQTMEKVGVADLAAAEQCERGMWVNAARLSTLIIVALAVAMILLPKAKAVSIVMALLALFWVGMSLMNGRRFLDRYKREELAEES